MSQSSARRRGGRQVRRKEKTNTPLIIGAAVVVVVIGLAITFSLLRNTSSYAGEQIPDMGVNQHLPGPNDLPPVPWNSNPPTSGYHWGGGTAPWGVQTQPLSDTMTVHNIEHGGVIIHYRQGLDQASVDQLTNISRTLLSQNPCLILVPRPANQIDSPIVLTSWNYLMRLDTPNEEAIRGFFRAHVGRGPEAVCRPSS